MKGEVMVITLGATFYLTWLVANSVISDYL